MRTNAMQTQDDADRPIYQDQTVAVTKTLVRVGTRSYPVNAIGSVDVVKPNRSKAISFAVASAIVAAVLAAGEAYGLPFLVCVISAVGFAAKAMTLHHALIIRTGSNDQQALTSSDVKYLTTVRSAIERAVVLRG